MLCIPYEEMKEGAEGEGVIPCDPQYCIHTIILNENSAGIIKVFRVSKECIGIVVFCISDYYIIYHGFEFVHF